MLYLARVCISYLNSGVDNSYAFVYKRRFLSSPAQVRVHVVGIMGKEIAPEFKNKYPEMFSAYKKACDEKIAQNRRECTKLEHIESGLIKFVQNYERVGIESIAFPELGCGNGGLDWTFVKPVMEYYLKLCLSMSLYTLIIILTALPN